MRERIYETAEKGRMGVNRRMDRPNLVEETIPRNSWKSRLSIQIPSKRVVSPSNESSNVDTENYVSSIVGIRTHTIGGFS